MDNHTGSFPGPERGHFLPMVGQRREYEMYSVLPSRPKDSRLGSRCLLGEAGFVLGLGAEGGVGVGGGGPKELTV